jgi:hypothetical protein
MLQEAEPCFSKVINEVKPGEVTCEDLAGERTREHIKTKERLMSTLKFPHH